MKAEFILEQRQKQAEKEYIKCKFGHKQNQKICLYIDMCNIGPLWYGQSCFEKIHFHSIKHLHYLKKNWKEQRVQWKYSWGSSQANQWAEFSHVMMTYCLMRSVGGNKTRMCLSCSQYAGRSGTAASSADDRVVTSGSTTWAWKLFSFEQTDAAENKAISKKSQKTVAVKSSSMTVLFHHLRVSLS